MSSVPEFQKRAYINVMEWLVAEEVERQLHRLPPRLQKYVKRLEVETYALNRLPALYASSEKGWQHQCEKARHEMGSQIKGAVQQALAAVQVDPLRLSQPLRVGNDEEAKAALQVLREMLQQPELTWEGIVNRLKQMLSKDLPKKAPEPPPKAKPPLPGQGHAHHWRPGTYGAEISWKPKPLPSGQQFDWNDPRYQK
ncbi:MAG: late competence development ComFB family protein [Cyanobacteria bacterium Co-bin8]|nr:late competence development ComFB family protein [Cyanobacteria bacterium Co-bin8]